MKEILRIVSFSKKFWRYYLFIACLITLISLLNLINPLINKLLVDFIVENINGVEGDVNYLIYLLIGYLLVDLFITVLTNLSAFSGDKLAQRLNTYLSKRFYKKILRLDLSYFDNEISGRIVSKLQRGILSITAFINQALNSFLPFFLTAFFTIIFLAFYSIEIAILLAILFPLYIVISDRSSKAWVKKQNEINEIQDGLFGRVSEVINSIRIVKSYVSQKLEFGTFSIQRLKIEELTRKQSFGYHSFDFLRRLILNVILFLIYAYIIYFTYTGRYTIGDMTLLLQLVNQARFPLFAMSFILGQIQQAQSGSKEFFDVLDTKIEIKDKKTAKSLKNVRGEIEFKNVDFGYQKDKLILKNFSFKLYAGEKLAIVGESGEGKSTLTNLILKFYKKNSGDILIDGKSIDSIKQNSILKNIAVVMQDTFLFSGSIYENISYGRQGASYEDVISASKSANAHDFIEKLEKGYDTQIGERGVKLSGGQKQRLSIARAILKDAPILILDEATSALDSKSEQEVQKALNRLMKNKTTLIIAHRLSTIKEVDKILVIKGGTIAEFGSPAELMSLNGIYAELVRLQKNALEAEKTMVENQEKLKEFNIG